ncbi:hypothetical protein [Pedobacter sp.]|uniref:hypothetical protein n=1 Tax=Pedobacter sp. TaxID=1411316 RepID=UPI003D7F2CBE
MKYILRPLCLFVLLLSACTNNSENQTAVQAAQFKSTTSYFSDSTKMDTFKVELTGVKAKEMLLIFRINSFKGKEIFRKVFKASALINNYKETVDLRKENEQREFMNKEFNLFLDEENFLWPALMPDERPDHNAKDLVFFKELQNSQLNGFKYRLGKESKAYIAWSEKEQKVKIYYECCS